MNRQGIRAMVETLTVTVPKNNAEAARELLVSTAIKEQARVVSQQTQRSGGVAPTLATVVDGVRGAPLQRVKPDGVILLEWGYVREVALAVHAALVAAGPRDTGAWRDSLVILAAGVETEAERIPHEAHTVSVVAPMPYARRLEIGKTVRGDPFVLQDEDFRLVERTALRLRRVYRSVARIGFTFVDLEGAYRRGGGQGRAVRYPAVTITGWQAA